MFDSTEQIANDKVFNLLIDLAEIKNKNFKHGIHFFLLALAFAIYTLVSFKRKPDDSAVNSYYNSKNYRLLILLILIIIAAIISFFVKKN